MEAEKQILKLADYILKHLPHEIGDEGAVDCAIRLLHHHVPRKYDPLQKVWSCKIGFASESELPPAGDGPLRRAVAKAFRDMLGRDDDFLSSGWGTNLSHGEAESVRAMKEG